MSLEFRWPVARLANRLRRTCWPDLVGWAMKGEGLGAEDARLLVGFDEYGDAPILRRRATSCEKAALDSGTCYCGKFARRDLPGLDGSTLKPAFFVSEETGGER